jgi:hypothetical protein
MESFFVVSQPTFSVEEQVVDATRNIQKSVVSISFSSLNINAWFLQKEKTCRKRTCYSPSEWSD